MQKMNEKLDATDETVREIAENTLRIREDIKGENLAHTSYLVLTRTKSYQSASQQCPSCTQASFARP
jgi:hypothetical protein